MTKIITLSELVEKKILLNKRIFIRSDLNVPRDNLGRITDDTRIRASIPAILLAISGGATSVMITSHLGRPKEGVLTENDSLIVIGQHLSSLLNLPVKLVKNWVDGFDMQTGKVFLLENCRGNIGEKENSDYLSKKIANLFDIYVNDAFGTSHRAEASTHGIAKFAKIACAGPLLVSELQALGKALLNPRKPLTAIVGGSKVSSKFSVLNKLSEKVDYLIVGGGIANTFLMANNVYIGKSLVELDQIEQARLIMKKMNHKGSKLIIPLDVIVTKKISNDATGEIRSLKQIKADDIILDVGPESIENLSNIIDQAGTILWNGPIGMFELDAFSNGTRLLALAISKTNAFSIAGGGDTIAAISKFDILDKIDYISTGGGAFLEFLEGKTLPALEILEKRSDESPVF